MTHRAIASACLFLFATGCGIAGETGDRAETDNVGSVAEGIIGAYNLSGGWKHGNIPVSIEQNGDNLTFIWPGHGPYNGRFSGPVTIVASFWGNCCTGIVSNGGQVIRWSEGYTWIRD